MYYNARTSLEDMWQGNPVLTAVIFGLPLGFLSLICYSIWCSDILDADEDGKFVSIMIFPSFQVYHSANSVIIRILVNSCMIYRVY